jgi:hypothetical protein
MLRLLVTANVVPKSPILFTLMMETIRSSKSSVLTRATRHNFSEDYILHSHYRENLKSFLIDVIGSRRKDINHLEKCGSLSDSATVAQETTAL